MATGNELIFGAELTNVNQAIKGWTMFTSNTTRDKDLRAFMNLVGSATLMLTGDKRTHVISKLNDYVNASQMWVSKGRSTTLIAERMLRGVQEVRTLMDMPEGSVAALDPIDMNRNAATDAAIRKVEGQLDEMTAAAKAEKEAREATAKAEKDAREAAAAEENKWPWYKKAAVVGAGGLLLKKIVGF